MPKANNNPRAGSSWGKVFLNTFLFLLACFIGGIIYLIILSRDLPSIAELQRFNPEQVSKILSADGKVIKELYIHKRDVVKISQIPRYLRHGLLAMEDRSFFEHSGISFQSLARAVVVNLMTLSRSQGASTITQQLARNMYNTIGFQKTYTRKLKELITSIKIEQTYTKSEIMELYLNSVYFGHGTYGVQAASNHYFGKDISKLKLDECALLIGLLPAPARYSPISHPHRAVIRRNLVLRIMKEQGYIEEEEYKVFTSGELPVKIIDRDGGLAPYFTEYIRRELEKIDEELDINLYKDGLIVHTTLDSRIQHALLTAFNKGIHRNQEILNEELSQNPLKLEEALEYSNYETDSVKLLLAENDTIPPALRNQLLVQGAGIVLDPASGHILGMIGGREEDIYRDHFNRATQAKRQPGSVFKPFIYLTALEEGHTTTTKLLNQPLVVFIDDTTQWNPQNHDGSTGLLTTIREGLRRSLNLISVRVVQELVEPKLIVKNAKDFGITTNIHAVDAIALGVSEVYPLEITAAYGTIANNGIYTKPIAITRIEDRHGRVIKNFVPHSREVQDESTIFILRDMMKSVVDGGTGGALRWKYKFYAPAAGKTGTTNSKADAWFVGFTPQLAIGIWIGMDDPAVSLGEKQFGSAAALPIFGRTIKGIYDIGEYQSRGETVLLNNKADWSVPPGVVEMEICEESFEKATRFCKTTKEIFLKENRPRRQCQIHSSPFSRFKDK
ncbi:MAG: PBP1A family penicillin-binding protein [Candidatus Marinimicrobia bacterium]|jgi:penicillin-binding protein 1A|nr:PBP1A family penicillin-binding protein [Candidatus Neomarinimicrobiota bacterium]